MARVVVYSFAVRGSHKLAILYLLSDERRERIGHAHKVRLAGEEEHEADDHQAGVSFPSA